VRIPFPERIPLTLASLFAVILCTVEIAQGTALLFVCCVFCFIVVAALAFNVAGGLTRPSGSYIFFFTILAVLVGLVWKAVLGEAADTNLSDSLLTMEAYLCGICGMLIAALISKRIRSKRAWLEGFVTEDKMQSAAVGCLVTGLALSVIFTISEVGSGSILSALAQVNRFLPLAVILGTIHAIRRSGGTRC